VVAALSPKREMFKHYPADLLATTRKLQTGRSSRRLPTTYGDKTQVEMAQLWEGDISESVASKAKRRSGKVLVSVDSLPADWKRVNG
jgi:hypothetical protein